MSTIGHSVDAQLENLAKLKGVTVADLLGFLGVKSLQTPLKLSLWLAVVRLVS